jgi:hypothetical protein
MSVLSSASGTDQARLVGEHDGLHPIVELELGEDTADVGLHGRFGEDESFGDLRVGVSGGDLDEYFALPRCERCQDLVGGRRARRAGCAACPTSAMTRVRMGMGRQPGTSLTHARFRDCRITWCPSSSTTTVDSTPLAPAAGRGSARIRRDRASWCGLDLNRSGGSCSALPT